MNPLFERFRDALRPEYELESELGRGGMGIVYLARDVSLRRHVAIKLLKPELATAPAVEAFGREAEALARIRCPNVVTVHTVHTRGGLWYFVMEYIRGLTLRERLLSGRLSPGDARRLSLDLLHGLEAVHAGNIIHRDLKPSNIFLARDRGVIGDLGIAQLEDDTGSGPAPVRDPRAGTTGYRSPEQQRGERPTRRTDIYQLGAVLYEVHTARRWPGEDAGARPDWTGVPRAQVPVLRRALALDPNERWPDVQAFRQALLAARPLWVRLAPVVLAAALIVLVVAIGQRLVGPKGGAGPVGPRVTLTLLHFTGPDTAAAAKLTRYAGERLERFSRIETRPVTLSLPLRMPADSADLARLNTVYFVTGDISGDTLLVLTAHTSRGRSLLDMRLPRGHLDRLAWGRVAADSLVHNLFASYYDEYRSVAGRGGSDDARAVDEYLAGVEAFQRDAYRLADQRFSHALDFDPAFALARWQLALVRRWRRMLTLADLVELYRRDSAGLEPRYLRLLQAQLEPDLPTRFARFREISTENPGLGAAWLLAADERFHRGALIGLPLDSALADMAAAIRADSTLDQAPALDHRIWGFIRLGKRDSARQALTLRRAVAAAHGSAQYAEGSLRTRVLGLAYDERFRPWRGDLELWWMCRHPDARLTAALAEYAHLGNAFDIPHAQQGFGEALVRSAGGDSLQAEGYEAQGLARVLLGRPGEALRDFDSAAVRFGTSAAALEAGEWRILPALLGLPALSNAETNRGLAAVRTFLDDPGLRARAAWALAAHAYAHGDTATGRRLARMLDPRAPGDEATERLRRLLAGLDSAAAGHFTGAIAVTTPLLRFDPEIRAGDPFARSVLYLARGAWLAQTNQREEAERALLWYENGDMDGWGQREAQAGMIDAALSAVARVRRARVVFERNRRSTGCEYLHRVDELWANAESGLLPLRDSVRAELAACR